MLPMTAASMCDLIEAYTGNTTAGAALAHVNVGYARVLGGLIPGSVPPRSHIWSFTRPYAEITLAATVTGTATGVYDDDAEQTTITATTGIFCPEHDGDTITVTDVGDLTIVDYTSSTVVVADEGEDFEAKAVSLPTNGIYDLPADFGGLVNDLFYPNEDDDSESYIRTGAVERILALRRDNPDVGDPEQCAVAPKAFTAATGQRWQLWVYPRPDAARIWRYRYNILPAALTDAAVYCVGSPMIDLAVLYAAYASAEHDMAHKPGYYEQLFAQQLAGAIAADARNVLYEPLSTRYS